ncbi:MAG: redox-sensing transcriptional repressor Rex [Candidatus Riflebacteria bacterium HGW-Riflebacteria-2]|jgi:redox-sensing transcriptional repressor|nr:MAG: redox-sensing transcriptional repressor Rex [Candidatus Riflebacteria bacterium HGW-Riflebacteria-2]
MSKNQKKISEKTIERLSAYRRYLKDLLKKGKDRVYSHELSQIVSGTAAQVRRDLMEVGCNGCSSKGYEISLLIEEISKLLDCSDKQNIALIGVGNLGRALLGYFSGSRDNFDIVAAFDSDPGKSGRIICGRRCYDMEQLPAMLGELKINTAILAVPAESAEKVAQTLIESGIKAILNFAPRHITTGSGVFIETLDMTSALEKAIYFSRKNTQQRKST